MLTDDLIRIISLGGGIIVAIALLFARARMVPPPAMFVAGLGSLLLIAVGIFSAPVVAAAWPLVVVAAVIIGCLADD